MAMDEKTKLLKEFEDFCSEVGLTDFKSIEGIYDNIEKYKALYDVTDIKVIKGNLKKIRKGKALTPAFFEKNAGISKYTYINYENPARNEKPSFYGLVRVCIAMDINFMDLFL